MLGFSKVAKTDDIKKSAVFNVEGEDIAVFNVDGEFYAVQNRCPHKGVPLYTGSVNQKVVTCPGHGWEFSLETGEGTIMPVCLKKYNTKIIDKELYVEL